MACLEGLQVVGEVCEQAFLLGGLEGGLTPDGPVKASQPLCADITRLRQQMQSVPATCCWRVHVLTDWCTTCNRAKLWVHYLQPVLDVCTTCNLCLMCALLATCAN